MPLPHLLPLQRQRHKAYLPYRHLGLQCLVGLLLLMYGRQARW
jgi:hypothetical protein